MKSDFTIKIKPLVSFLQTLFFFAQGQNQCFGSASSQFCLLLLSIQGSKPTDLQIYTSLIHCNYWRKIQTLFCAIKFVLFNEKKNIVTVSQSIHGPKEKKSDYVIDCRENEVCIYAQSLLQINCKTIFISCQRVNKTPAL